ncbi:MAG TPA: hypothetical protein VLK25_08465 [Allosphingosinicella sp.]|nr:hypothetical protein [Allosphingosinicella sp.]
MRRSLSIFALLLATTACSQYQEGGTNRTASSGGDNAVSDVALEAAPDGSSAPAKAGEAGPEIDPNNAPGVAFAYRYAFSLEAPRVAEVQQEHQRLCESYGIARCRITGMSYRATSEEDVEATLSFNVDPAIASRFTRDSVGAVTAAEGRLADSEINGTDVGTSIDATTRDISAMRAQAARLEARIAAGGLSREERERLQGEAEALRQRMQAQGEERAGQERSLATTPILFRYGAGTLAPGPGRELSLGEATQETGADVIKASYWVLRVLIVLAPWLIVGLLGWWGFVRLRRRFAPAATPPAAETEAAA